MQTVTLMNTSTDPFTLSNEERCGVEVFFFFLIQFKVPFKIISDHMRRAN